MQGRGGWTQSSGLFKERSKGLREPQVKDFSNIYLAPTRAKCSRRGENYTKAAFPFGSGGRVWAAHKLQGHIF